MNKTVTWVVIAILIIGGAYLLFGRNNKLADDQKTGTSATTTTSTGDSTAQTAGEPQSLKDLLALGTSQKCSFTDESNSGNFYVSGGKARGDFTTTVDNKPTQGHMIMENQTAHMWMDGQSQGFKMSTAVTEQTPAAAQTSQAVDTNKKMDYSCQPWAADSSMFSLPSGIEFMDLSSFQPSQ